MILTCPECSARYVVDPQALLPNGRTVRCAKCKYSWKEDAPDQTDDLAQVIRPPQEDSRSDGGDDARKHKGDDQSDPEDAGAPEVTSDPESEEDDFAIRRAQRKKRPRPLPKGSNLPALQNHNHGGILWGWYGLGAFVVIILSSFLFFQSTISEAWPPSQKLYHILGMTGAGLEHNDPHKPNGGPEIPLREQFKIGEVKLSKTQSGAVVTLTIDGNITNISHMALPLPLLKVFLKDDKGQVIREWSFKLTAATLAKDKTLPFSTSLPNPPEEATSISVTFAKRQA